MNVPSENKRTPTRRNVIRTAGIAGLSAIPFASGTVAARSGDTTKDGYKINENGFIEYNGPRDANYIEETVTGMNEAKRNGEVEFEIRNDRVYLVGTEPALSTQSVNIAAACSGNQGYSTSFKLNGIQHKLELDSCTTNDIIDIMIAGVAAAQLAAIISAGVGAMPAAAASECAAVLLAAGWQIIDNNANGNGIEILWLMPFTAGGFHRWDIDPQ